MFSVKIITMTCSVRWFTSTAKMGLMLLLIAAPSVRASDVAVAAEELPQPEALRSSMLGGNSLRPSYDPRDAYNSLRMSHKMSRESRQGSETALRLEEKLRRALTQRKGSPVSSRPSQADEDLVGAASSSDYGGYASESSYGLTCTSGYVNTSAVALLAFLFLLNIVQDVITQITGRRKRSTDEETTPLEQFLVDGGVDGLYEDLPAVLLPLMVKLSDAQHPRCVRRPLCEANLHLSQTYGPVGRVVGSLVSNIAAKTFSGARAAHFDEAIEAAATGRSGSCHLVPACFQEAEPQPHYPKS
ncbi:uncharacterized protein LOC108673689 isoform X2 [Hyalella azteca]|uniref:Uncharacterized protein LOC108673689 isoform X2 n=1 Tax=Hyalella azteca TaxID=294128 RepID=A0A8B7NTF3_HYAAZ|nr:uncharacterized protein LOC108673689 isoform X2 [Hyalella azteca]